MVKTLSTDAVDLVIFQIAMKCKGKCQEDWDVNYHGPGNIFHNMPRPVDMFTKNIKSTQKQCQINPGQEKSPTK